MANPVAVTAILLMSFYIAANKEYLTKRNNFSIPSAISQFFNIYLGSVMFKFFTVLLTIVMPGQSSTL